MYEKDKITLLGVYATVDEAVYLLEFRVNDSPSAVNLDAFALKEKGVPRSDWQVPYDERYLNEGGTQVIGDYLDRNELPGESSRIVFFLYVEDLTLPLLTPYGEISLPEPTEMPERLKEIIPYLPFD